MIDSNNFHKNTMANFSVINEKAIFLKNPDFISYKKKVVFGDAIKNEEFKNCKILNTFVGKLGDDGFLIETKEPQSKYWFTEKGVYRFSDHWGKVGNCIWNVEGYYFNYNQGEFFKNDDSEILEEKLCFSNWENFKNLKNNKNV